MHTISPWTAIIPHSHSTLSRIRMHSIKSMKIKGSAINGEFLDRLVYISHTLKTDTSPPLWNSLTCRGPIFIRYSRTVSACWSWSVAESVQCISISVTWVDVGRRRVKCRRFDIHPSFKRRACEQDERGARVISNALMMKLMRRLSGSQYGS